MTLRKKSSRGDFYFLMKIIAVIVCLCMVPVDVTYAAPDNVIPAKAGILTGSRIKDFRDDITIPSEFGTTEESHQGSNGKTIIYIQDAHDSLDAQVSIAKIIHHLVENNGVKTVFEEGYEGANLLDEYFAEIGDPVIKQRVTYFFMDKLRISGAEYAYLNRAQDFDLQGADSLELHRENVKWYQASAKLQDAIQKDLQAMERPLRALADKSFSKEMKAWMRLKERFDADELDLLNYLKRLTSLTDVLEWHDASHPYTNLSLLLVAAKTEPNSEILEQAQAIDHQIIFREINQFENELTSTFLQSDRDRQILSYYKIIQLLKRLVRLEVTFAEYEALRESFSNFDTPSFARFLVAHTNQSIVLSKEWERNLKNALKFYEFAEARDRVVEASLSHLKGHTAALVFGGFHKTNLKRILRETGYSYVIITPKIDRIEKRHRDYYRELMQLGYSSVELPGLMATATRHPGFQTIQTNSKFQPRVRKLVARARSKARFVASDFTTEEDLKQVNREMMLRWRQPSGSNVLPTLDTGSLARSEARAFHDRIEIVEEFDFSPDQLLQAHEEILAEDPDWQRRKARDGDASQYTFTPNSTGRVNFGQLFSPYMFRDSDVYGDNKRTFETQVSRALTMVHTWAGLNSFKPADVLHIGPGSSIHEITSFGDYVVNADRLHIVAPRLPKSTGEPFDPIRTLVEPLSRWLESNPWEVIDAQTRYKFYFTTALRLPEQFSQKMDLVVMKEVIDLGLTSEVAAKVILNEVYQSMHAKSFLVLGKTDSQALDKLPDVQKLFQRLPFLAEPPGSLFDSDVYVYVRNDSPYVEIGSEKYLRGILGQEGATELRGLAAKGYVDYGYPDAKNVLLDALEKVAQDDASTRTRILTELARIQDSEIGPILLQAFVDEADPHYQQFLAHAIKDIGYQAAVPVFQAIVDRGEYSNLRYALEGIIEQMTNRSEARIASSDVMISLADLKPGPTEIFADLNSEFKSRSEAREFVKELATLKELMGVEVTFYNGDIVHSESHVKKVVDAFPKRFHMRSGSFSDVLGGLKKRDDINYVHYARSESRAMAEVAQVPPSFADQVYYVIGNPGSAVYSLYEIAAIKLKETLPDRGIEYRNGIHWISDKMSSWMNAILDLQTHIEFAKAA